MKELNPLHRITSDPEIFGGKPSIRGTRLAVEHVMAMMAAGDSEEDILSAYPSLEPEDIRACMLYERENLPPRST